MVAQLDLDTIKLIVEAIKDDSSLLSLALTSHTFLDTALDCLWADASLSHLAVTMPSQMWRITQCTSGDSTLKRIVSDCEAN